ncbi:MAG: hypothetical protein KZY55_00055, partial [Paeniclostridium sp.]
NIIKEIKIFILNNKLLNLILAIAIIIIISYRFTMNWKEIIPGVGIIYEMLDGLANAYLASYVFYMVQGYYPKRKLRIKMNSKIHLQLKRLSTNMKIMIDEVENERCDQNEIKRFIEERENEQKFILNSLYNISEYIDDSTLELIYEIEVSRCIKSLEYGTYGINSKYISYYERIWNEMAKY